MECEYGDDSIEWLLSSYVVVGVPDKETLSRLTQVTEGPIICIEILREYNALSIGQLEGTNRNDKDRFPVRRSRRRQLNWRGSILKI